MKSGFFSRPFKYLEVARIACAGRMAFFGDFLARPLFFAVILFVFFQLWEKVFTPDRPVVAGFSVSETLWYLVMTEAILLSTPRFDGRVDDEIKSGSIAYLLQRPCNYVWYHVFWGLGESLPIFFLNACSGGLVAYLLLGKISFIWTGIPLVFTAVTGAMILYIFVALCIALLAFWIEDTTPFFWIYQKMLFICGGLMIPLDFFPDWVRPILDALPFRTILYGPAKLFVQFSGVEAIRLLVWQGFWIFVFGGIAMGMFNLGTRKVHIHGG